MTILRHGSGAGGLRHCSRLPLLSTGKDQRISKQDPGTVVFSERLRENIPTGQI